MLGKIIAEAAKYSAKHGGILWLVGDGRRRVVLTAREGTLLQIRAPEVPDGVLAVHAEEASKMKAALERLGAVNLSLDRRLWLHDGQSHVALTLADPSTLPPPIALNSVTWHALDPVVMADVLRVADVAAKEKIDRPGLTWVQIGRAYAEATDEVVIARAPVELPFAARVPAYVLDAVSTKGRVFIGELGGGACALAWDGEHASTATRVLIVADGGREVRFPDLRRPWANADAEPVRYARVLTAELKRALRASVAEADARIVTLSMPSAGVLVLEGQAARIAVPTEGDDVGAPTLRCSPEALAKALPAGAKTVEIGWTGSRSPVRVREGAYRALIYPVVQGH